MGAKWCAYNLLFYSVFILGICVRPYSSVPVASNSDLYIERVATLAGYRFGDGIPAKLVSFFEIPPADTETNRNLNPTRDVLPVYGPPTPEYSTQAPSPPETTETGVGVANPLADPVQRKENMNSVVRDGKDNQRRQRPLQVGNPLEVSPPEPVSGPEEGSPQVPTQVDQQHLSFSQTFSIPRTPNGAKKVVATFVYYK